VLNDQWVIVQIRREIKSFLEVNENETQPTRTYGTQQKAVLRRKFIAMSAYIKRTERSQINDLMLHLNLLEKQEQAKPRRREIMKIRTKINKLETKTPYKESNKTKSWFFEKLNMIDKPLANVAKMRREKTQISKIRNEKEELTINTREIRESSETTTLRTYIPINWKMLKKWTNF
jgi:hypothetical protein